MEALKFKNMIQDVLANYEFNSVSDQASFINILEDIYVKNIYNKLNESNDLEELKETMKSILFSEIQYNGELKKLIKNKVDIEGLYSELTYIILEAVNFNKKDYTETFYNIFYKRINKDLKTGFKYNGSIVPQVLKNIKISKAKSIEEIVDIINVLNKRQHCNADFLDYVLESEKYNYLNSLKKNVYEPFSCEQCEEDLEDEDYIIINHDNMKDVHGKHYKFCSLSCAYEYIENNNIDIY